MVLELVGSRLLAPYFGNSIFVWTSLIGVILGFIALGNFMGGRLGDRRLSDEVLMWILVGVSASISIVAFSDSLLLPSLARGSSLKAGAVIAAVILYGLPSTLLGMVSPYCIRLKMHAISDSGATVGSLYALSTLGSIVGTFAAGFWLITVVGSHDLLAVLAAVPLVLSLFFVGPVSARRIAGVLVAAAILAAAALTMRPLAGTFDTTYDRYIIRRATENATMRPLVALSRRPTSTESEVYADTGEPFLFDYYAYYDTALKLAPNVDRTLLIGGGIFSYPRRQLALRPTSAIDVVEIDPKLVEVARSTFYLKDDPRMRIIVEDGRMFLNTTSGQGQYDVVFLDAFKSAETVPYQLTTYQSMKRCYDVLGEHGVLAVNTIGSVSGPGSKFVWAEYATLKAVFPQVAVFAADSPNNPSEVQNMCMIASKDASTDLVAAVQRVSPGLAANRIAFPRVPEGTRILTDDFAPVDQYLIGL